MPGELESLFARYETVVVLDTETSGLFFDRDEIIELAAVAVQQHGGRAEIVQEYDRLIHLTPGRRLSPRIVELTHITDEEIAQNGISKAQACRDFADLVSRGKTLIVAYNAHFDLSFLYYFLRRDGDPTVLRDPDMLDAMSVYKDRREYPHKLLYAIEAYGLQDQVVNSHRAIDDVKATLEVLKAMDRERDDLHRYVNLFGYNPKYGVQGRRIGSITYAPQPFDRREPLYEAASPAGI